MSEKLSEYCRRQASRPCPEDYGFNVEWNLAADDALALEAKLEAMERINDTLLHLCAEAKAHMPYYPEMGKRDWHERFAAAQKEQEDE